MKKQIKYAGIGSRQTPTNVLGLMSQFAYKAETAGWKLRSGSAKGADGAFSAGCICDFHKEIYLPYGEIPVKAYEIAMRFHPAWSRCSDFARRAHARNILILLGENLNDPVDMVICWTFAAQVVGGTGHSTCVANAHDIPVHNLGLMTIPKMVSYLNHLLGF